MLCLTFLFACFKRLYAPFTLIRDEYHRISQSQFYLSGLRYHGVNNNCGISNKAGKSKFRLLSMALEYRMLNRDSDQHQQMGDVEEEVRGGRSKSSITADGWLWLHCQGGATG